MSVETNVCYTARGRRKGEKPKDVGKDCKKGKRRGREKKREKRMRCLWRRLKLIFVKAIFRQRHHVF